jgi:hypothetical protein
MPYNGLNAGKYCFPVGIDSYVGIHGEFLNA